MNTQECELPPILDEDLLAAMDADPFGDGPLPKPRKPRKAPKPYDPGQPKECSKIGDGLYEVQSWRDPNAAPYVVDLKTGECSCPQFQKRLKGTEGRCKHHGQAVEESRRRSTEIAESLSFSDLEKQAERTDLRMEQIEALKDALWKRLAEDETIPFRPLSTAPMTVISYVRTTDPETGKIMLTLPQAA